MMSQENVHSGTRFVAMVEVPLSYNEWFAKVRAMRPLDLGWREPAGRLP